MISNFERFQKIQFSDFESYSFLCHVEPKNLPISPYLWPRWSGTFTPSPSKLLTSFMDGPYSCCFDLFNETSAPPWLPTCYVCGIFLADEILRLDKASYNSDRSWILPILIKNAGKSWQVSQFLIPKCQPRFSAPAESTTIKLKVK